MPQTTNLTGFSLELTRNSSSIPTSPDHGILLQPLPAHNYFSPTTPGEVASLSHLSKKLTLLLTSFPLISFPLFQLLSQLVNHFNFSFSSEITPVDFKSPAVRLLLKKKKKTSIQLIQPIINRSQFRPSSLKYWKV